MIILEIFGYNFEISHVDRNHHEINLIGQTDVNNSPPPLIEYFPLAEPKCKIWVFPYDGGTLQKH